MLYNLVSQMVGVLSSEGVYIHFHVLVWCSQVRVNCLVCVGKLLEHLDKWLVLDEVLPFLPQIPSREPAVLMGILGMLCDWNHVLLF
jgi:hypothetical protein